MFPVNSNSSNSVWDQTFNTDDKKLFFNGKKQITCCLRFSRTNMAFPKNDAFWTKHKALEVMVPKDFYDYAAVKMLKY